MTSVGKMEHIKAILGEYENKINIAEQAYKAQIDLYLFTADLQHKEGFPQSISKHSIETQAVTALEKIKGFLDE